MIGFELSPGVGQGRRPAPRPLASFFANGGGQSVALAPGLDGGLTLWTEVGPNHAARLRLDQQDAGTRLSWRETQLAELRNVYTVSMMTLTGSWSQLQTSGSGRAASYTGNRAISSGSAGATATVQVDRDRPYDLWINYTGRTSGGYVRVEIDGAQTLVNEIADPAGLGFKAFSSYAPTDLTRRQTIKVASGLTGPHDVSLRFGGAATPGGGAIMLEAVTTSGSLDDPYILPPVWQPNTTYQMGDEVQFGGMYYAARANGSSGATGPTHSAGIASDGALDWRADNRPTYPEFTIIDYASEREYAARVDVAGDVIEVGGQTHGHDALVSQTIAVDGVPWVPVTGGHGLTVGTQISIVEETIWQTGGSGPLANCQTSRSITPGTIQHNMQVDITVASMDVEWLYAGMLPFVRWEGETASTVVDTLEAQDGTVVTLANYAGQTDDEIDFPMVHRLGLVGTTPVVDFVYGHEAGALPVAGNRLDQFEAFVLPNIDGRTASGSTDWPAKAYIRASPQSGLTLQSGDIAHFYNRHVLAAVT
ncbi:hypothetical protein BC777_3112 [Yoonia maricola]|uniref:Carbohydrate binding protein n=1 Tax=Yoonia maricola TaxID=420999 RepID=A0A2M8W2G0_9RHOB|nr:hypothetical protein [Yoonia maricola]PJI85116.1 hypothetical protein BC777_3112 [Yoonia maricola]